MILSYLRTVILYLILIAVIYLIIVLVLEQAQKRIEKTLARGDR